MYKVGLKSVAARKHKIFYETDTGRELIFHGLNAVVKGYPWLPMIDKFDVDVSLTDLDHATLADLGVNAYRLGVMWAGVEPQQGAYNDTYLNEVKRIITSASNYGIYTLMDMHQDLLSEKFCGEGFPSWVIDDQLHPTEQPNVYLQYQALKEAMFASDNVKKFPWPFLDGFNEMASDGFPKRSDCAKISFGNAYVTLAVSLGWMNLYQNNNGILDAWGRAWGYIANSIATSEAINCVLGYELVNEPLAGNVYDNPFLLAPAVADRWMLEPAYDVLTKSIRVYDNETLVFFSAVTWDDFVQAGFLEAPGGIKEADKAVFAFHYYEPPQFTGQMNSYFNLRTDDAKRLHTGAMLTEFERPPSTNELDGFHFDETVSSAEEHLLSWLAWEYKPFCQDTNESVSSDRQQGSYGACKTGGGSYLIFNKNGTINNFASRKIARTYAQKIAGYATSMSFNVDTADFFFTFIVNTSITLPTEVFAHQNLHYRDGMSITVSPQLSLTWTMLSTNVIGFTANKALLQSGQEVSIKITTRARARMMGIMATTVSTSAFASASASASVSDFASSKINLNEGEYYSNMKPKLVPQTLLRSESTTSKASSSYSLMTSALSVIPSKSFWYFISFLALDVIDPLHRTLSSFYKHS